MTDEQEDAHRTAHDHVENGSSSAEDRKPVESVLPALQIHPLEEGDVWSFAFCLIKTEDADGCSSWAFRTSHAPNKEELLGALLVQVDLLKQEILERWQ